jgi:hypothetical protein
VSPAFKAPSLKGDPAPMKTLGLCVLAVLAIGAIAAVFIKDRPQPQAPKTPARLEDAHYNEARYMCEQWTAANSKLEVDKVLGWNKLKKAQHNLYAVRVEYRAKPLGAVMITDCTYQITGENDPILLVKAFSRAR